MWTGRIGLKFAVPPAKYRSALPRVITRASQPWSDPPPSSLHPLRVTPSHRTAEIPLRPQRSTRALPGGGPPRERTGTCVNVLSSPSPPRCPPELSPSPPAVRATAAATRAPTAAAPSSPSAWTPRSPATCPRWASASRTPSTSPPRRPTSRSTSTASPSRSRRSTTRPSRPRASRTPPSSSPTSPSSAWSAR